MPSTPKASVLRPMGTMLWCEPGGRERAADTLMCVHCGYHWEVKPGSGKRRGFCMKCMGVTCDQPGCIKQGCIPLEKRLTEPHKIDGGILL